MWADAPRDGRPAEYRWRPLRKFRHSILLVPRRKVWLTPAAVVPCSDAANIGERKTWTQSAILHMAKFRQGARAAENVYTQ